MNTLDRYCIGHWMQIESMIHEWQPDSPAHAEKKFFGEPREQRKFASKHRTTKGGMVHQKRRNVVVEVK
jgi:hypothetical protein